MAFAAAQDLSFSGFSFFFDTANIWCIVFFPVLKPLACGRQSRCLGWTYINCLAAWRSVLNFPSFCRISTEKTFKSNKKGRRFINSPGVRFINHPACDLYTAPFSLYIKFLHCQNFVLFGIFPSFLGSTFSRVVLLCPFPRSWPVKLRVVHMAWKFSNGDFVFRPTGGGWQGGFESSVLSGPNRAMQPRCAMRFESHTPKSLAMRKVFFR